MELSTRRLQIKFTFWLSETKQIIAIFNINIKQLYFQFFYSGGIKKLVIVYPNLKHIQGIHFNEKHRENNECFCVVSTFTIYKQNYKIVQNFGLVISWTCLNGLGWNGPYVSAGSTTGRAGSGPWAIPTKVHGTCG